ncbi:MAG: RIP metalloprotease RseP [Chloroflexia bacterium]|nr:RIP metalloprotease RseP [Chloroflexia bacterium]
MVTLIKAAQLILSLSILVIFHEMGHFAFARLFKTRVEKFYLFFNPWFSLFKTKWGETEYGIGWLPLGGYVKISGMIDESMDKEQMKQPPQPWEFRTKKSWQRLLIMLGGVLVNFVLAFLIYTMILTVWGRSYIANEKLEYGVYVDSLAKEFGLREGDKIVSLDGEKLVEFRKFAKKLILDNTKVIKVERDGQLVDVILPADVEEKIINHKKALILPRRPFIISGFIEGSPAELSDLKVGDRIVGIDSTKTEFFDNFVPVIKKYAGKEVGLKVLRGDKEITVKIDVAKDSTIGAYNNYAIETLEYNFFEAIPASFPLGYELITDQLKQLRLLPSNMEHVGGFGAIGGIFPATWDWEQFWVLTAMLSIMLAVLNLLPIPALDGGHVMFLLYEMVSGRKPSEKFLERATTVGMILLLALLVYANGNDIFKLIFK